MQATLFDQGKDAFGAAPIEGVAAKANGKRATIDDLELSRRLDWRMLLAKPRLKRVAYVGKDSGPLVEALKRFSESLTVFASAEESFAASQSKKAFDLLVFDMPSPRDVEMMRHLLKPEGSIYAELHRPRRSLKKSLLLKKGAAALKLPQYLSVLQQAGFPEIDIYWHRPNFEHCVEIIPLNDPLALRHVFSRQGSGLKSRLKLFAGRLAMRFGLLSHVVDCASIVASKTTLIREPA